MLILSRTKRESLVIGDNVTITVVEIRGDTVRLAIQCPKEMTVHRQEVYDLIHRPMKPPLLPPEQRGFVQAILESPDDEGIRLIFADWLEEHGDPRGEFIRTQCLLAQLPPEDERRPLLQERQRALLTEHEAVWRSYLPAVLRSAHFQRGFVEAAQMSLSEFLANAEDVFATAPLRYFRICNDSGLRAESVATLAVSPYLARLAGLDLSEQNLDDDAAACLAASCHLASLRILTLRGNRIRDIGAASLAGSASLVNLDTLDLSDNPLGDEGKAFLRQRFGERVRL